MFVLSVASSAFCWCLSFTRQVPAVPVRTVTDMQTHRHTDTQTRRHTDTQTHRHTDTQTHKQTDTRWVLEPPPSRGEVNYNPVQMAHTLALLHTGVLCAFARSHSPPQCLCIIYAPHPFLTWNSWTTGGVLHSVVSHCLCMYCWYKHCSCSNGRNMGDLAVSILFTKSF